MGGARSRGRGWLSEILLILVFFYDPLAYKNVLMYFDFELFDFLGRSSGDAGGEFTTLDTKEMLRNLLYMILGDLK